MTTNNDDTQNEVSEITPNHSKNNGLSDKNAIEVITPNNIQTNSDDTNLTEQWKKGELPYGRYYVELAYNGNNIIMAEYWWDKALMLDDHEYSREEVKRILAPVPSYHEYLESESHCAIYSDVNKSLKEENQQLKELLRECHSGFRKLPIYNLVDEDEAREVNKLLNKIDNAIGEK